MVTKQRKRRKSNRRKKILFEFFVFFAFFVLIFILFRIGQSFLNARVPKNVQNLDPVALGIDVSEWNTDIQWDKVKQDGYSFAIIRAGFGVDGTEDSRLYEHVQGAKEAGFKIGVYYYSHATTPDEAIKEADAFISFLEPFEWDYPVFYDIETDRQDHLDRDELTEIVQSFLERVSEAGYQAGLYAPKYWLEQRLNVAELEDYAIWVANYTEQLEYQGKVDLWQYSKNGKIDGIAGDVDIDILYTHY